MKVSGNNEKTLTSSLLPEPERWRYPRFFADTNLLAGEEAYHALQVLRMKPGELAVIAGGSGVPGTESLARLARSGNDTAEFEIIDTRDCGGEPNVFFRLWQCVPKGEKLDFIVQKATELGVSEIIPVLSDRCVSRPDGKSAIKKQERLQRIAHEAAKQSGRGRIPAVSGFVPLNTLLKNQAENTGAGIMKIFFYESGGESLSVLFPEFPEFPGFHNSPEKIIPAKEIPAEKTPAKESVREIIILTGPEGGFTAAEAGAVQTAGFLAATLGKRILRAETAPLAALAVLLNLTGNM